MTTRVEADISEQQWLQQQKEVCLRLHEALEKLKYKPVSMPAR